MEKLKRSWNNSRQQFYRGLKYSLLFVAVGAVMGAIYGLFGGRVISPVIFSITLTGIFVVLNFFVALVLGILNFFPALFRRGSAGIARYFALSSAFLVVYMLFFAFFRLAEIEVF